MRVPPGCFRRERVVDDVTLLTITPSYGDGTHPRHQQHTVCVVTVELVVEIDDPIAQVDQVLLLLDGRGMVAHPEQRDEEQDLGLELVYHAGTPLSGEVGSDLCKCGVLLLLHLGQIALQVLPLHYRDQHQDVSYLLQMGTDLMDGFVVDGEDNVDALRDIPFLFQLRPLQ